MGLCKCPKRKVTNLFCFEHRVNVCEHCLVANHTKCIVKSYLQWLQDSDYNPICTLCNRGLSDENCGECIRLTCYDVFHWGCLNYYAQQMPPHTAPAGYACPACNTCIFPQNNMASPVAEYLKGVLQQVNWARAGLGLPLMEEADQPPPPAMALPANGVGTSPNLRSDANLEYASGLGDTPVPQAMMSAGNNSIVGSRPSAQVAPYQATPPSGASMGAVSHSVISVDEGTSARGQLATNPRKLFDSTKEDAMYGMSTVRPHDHDEDKYKRRPALQWLGQWFNSVDKKGRKDPNAVRKRFAIVILLGIIGFITIVIIFSKLGRQATEDDPFFDPLANPNIKVENDAAILS